MRAKSGNFRTGRGRFAMMASCLAGAGFLIIFALLQGGGDDDRLGGWLPLNEAVQERLSELEAQAVEESADQASNLAMEQAIEESGPESTPGEKESSTETSGEDAGKLDINRATAEQLDGLKGIGPSKAQAIIADRERNGYFASVDELLRVKGIGEKLLAGLKDSVVAMP